MSDARKSPPGLPITRAAGGAGERRGPWAMWIQFAPANDETGVPPVRLYFRSATSTSFDHPSRQLKAMALVTISGFPSAGKTRRAQELKAYFEAKLASGEGSPITAVTIVDDESVHVTRAAYDGE